MTEHKSRYAELLKTFLLIIFAEIGNLLVYFACKSFPLYMDTVFTVAITFYAGLVPGLVVAAAYNPIATLLIYFFSDKNIGIFPFFYTVCGMLIAFVTWLFSRKKDNFSYSRNVTFLYLLVISLASAFACCFSAAFIDTVIRPFFNTPELTTSGAGYQKDALCWIFSRFGYGTFLSFLLPRIPITVVDRIICTFAGFGVCKLYLRIENRGRI